MKFLLLCVVLVTGMKYVTAQGACPVTETALAELEEMKLLVDQLAVLVETIIEGPIPEPPVAIINPTLTVAWNEVSLSWTIPKGANGFLAQVIADGVAKPIVRLPATADTFTTTDIKTEVEHVIKITPIKADGPGVEFTTDPFTPECPKFCPLIYAPVCGTDGITYASECMFEVAQCQSEDAIEIAYETECDECANIQCGVPVCPEGFKLGDAPLPGECCVGCVDKCEGIQCTPLACAPGYAATVLEGECCPICELTAFIDCSDAMANGMTTSGVYRIQPTGTDIAFDAYCDMDIDGGRWTVALRRTNSTVDFYRDYQDYVDGFGDVTGAFWLGLEKLHTLNKQGNTELLVQMIDQRGTAGAAKYINFRLGSATDKYPLESVAGFREEIAGFPTAVGNALFYNKGAAFSARDQDNDLSARSCATELVGAWWFKGGMCTRSNPLGEYMQRDDRQYEKGVFWAPFRGKQHSLKFFAMMVRTPA